MRFALYVAAALALASSATLRAQPAMQPYYPGFAGLPPYEIVALVRSAGFDPVSRPVRQGPVYVLRALNPAGQEMRVVVDARMGRIVKVAAVAPTDPGGFAPPASIPSARPAPDGNAAGSRSAAIPSGDDDMEFEPIHPGAPIAAAPKPPTRAAAKPPPLPRPRPKQAADAASAAAPSTPAPAADPAPVAAPASSPPPASTGPSASAENTPASAEIDE